MLIVIVSDFDCFLIQDIQLELNQALAEIDRLKGLHGGKPLVPSKTPPSVPTGLATPSPMRNHSASPSPPTSMPSAMASGSGTHTPTSTPDQGQPKASLGDQII